MNTLIVHFDNIDEVREGHEKATGLKLGAISNTGLTEGMWRLTFFPDSAFVENGSKLDRHFTQEAKKMFETDNGNSVFQKYYELAGRPKGGDAPVRAVDDSRDRMFEVHEPIVVFAKS